MTEAINNDFLSRIEKEEYQSSWSNKLFGSTSIIFTTKQLSAGFNKNISFSTQKTFLPSKKYKILLSVFAAFLLFLIFFILKENLIASIIIVPVYTFGIFKILKDLTSRNLNYPIHLTTLGIQVMDKLYEWQDVKETYIVLRQRMKGRAYFLLVGLNNGELDRYDLTNLKGFSITAKKFAVAIEYYKENYA